MRSKTLRKIHNNIIDIPVSFCIFLIIAGILVGSAFFVDTMYLKKPIDREEAIPTSGIYDTYELYYGKTGAVNDVCIFFVDGDKCYINAASLNIQVEETLDTLVRGDEVEMLLHPNSNDIWELKRGQTMILDFDDAARQMRGDNIGFNFLGTFCMTWVLIGVISLLLQFGRRKGTKHRSKV